MEDLVERTAVQPSTSRPRWDGIDDCDFARHLVLLRLRRSMRQVDLAERSGLSVRTISDLERGISAAPRLSTLDLLERGLDLAAADRQRLREVAACARFRSRLSDLAAAGRPSRASR